MLTDLSRFGSFQVKVSKTKNSKTRFLENIQKHQRDLHRLKESLCMWGEKEELFMREIDVWVRVKVFEGVGAFC